MVVLSVVGKLIKWLLILLILLAVTGALWQQWSIRQDERNFPPPGDLVSIGSHRLHIYCQGEETSAPTVLLDGGATFIATGWQWVMDDLARTTRVCAFDRSGIGWSEEGVHPYDGPQMAKELNTLLENANIKRPVLYIGHSLGGDLGRIYFDHYPEDMTGLIMIEAGDPDLILGDIAEDRGEPVERTEGIRPCGKNCTLATIAAHLGVVRLALGQVDLLDDPLYPSGAADAYRARMSLAVNLRQAMAQGRYITRILYQTRDNTSLGDLPVMGIYSTGAGSLLGGSSSEEEIKEYLIENIAAWKRTTATSTRDMGVHALEGGNHLAVVGYKEFAEQIADLTREMIDEIEHPEG